MNTRFDRSRLNIGAYVLQPYARDEKHIKEIKECGIDMIIDMGYDIKTLEIFSKYGIGAIVRGATPGWWGGNGVSGKCAEINPLEIYDECAKKYVDHPAIWGISIGDEPSALDIPHFGRILHKVENIFPCRFAYLNLYPNYATVAQNTLDETKSQLGTKTYEEYVRVYCESVPADYISYDYYVYATKNLAGCLDNFRIVTDAARKYGKRFMYIAQVNSQNPAEIVTVNQLRFQAFSAMSFGAEDISWGCYTGGWWHHNVLDEKGEKTEQYDKLKTVNAEIRRLSDTYMKYKTTSTHLVCFPEEIAEKSHFENLDFFSDGYFTGLRAEDGRALLVGEMSCREEKNSKALFITVCDDYMDTNPTKTRLIFESIMKVRAYGKDGEVEVVFDETSGKYFARVCSNDGIMLVAE